MSKNVKMTNPMKVITGPNTRWSYTNVWKSKSINGGTPKYSVSLIIPKSNTKTVSKIEAAIKATYCEGESKLKGNGKSIPALSVLKTPLRDGDRERPENPAYAGSYFVNANATSAPGIVDADRNPILTHSEVYSGVYGRAGISFYAFTALVIRALPAFLIICRRFVMASLLVARHLLNPTSQLTTIIISLINGGDKLWGQL